MGKSTIAGMFRHHGVPTHDSDQTVHDLMKPNGAAFPAIAHIFPEVIKDNEIDRRALGALVFNSPKKKQALEAILHPMVRSLSNEFVRQNRFQGRRLIVLDIPLLFETGADRRVDYTVCVSAPYYIQKRRVMQRQGMTEEKLKSILQSQMPDAFKRCCSDFIINTARSKAQSMRDVKKIIARVI